MKPLSIAVVSIVLLLLMLGLVMIISIAGNPTWDSLGIDGRSVSPVRQQAVLAIVGLGLMFLLASADPLKLRNLALPFSCWVLVLLVMVLIPGIALRIRGACRLLPVGPIVVQPSDLARLALPLFLARWFDWCSPGRRGRASIPIAAIGLTAFLIGYEPDYTSALLAIFTGLVLLVLGRVSLPLIGLLCSIMFCAASISVMSDAETCRRMLSLFGYCDAPHRLWPWEEAIRNAGWWGAGLGQGQMVPRYYYDAPGCFITAVIGEELGWAMLLFTAVAYGALTVAGVCIAGRAGDRFGYLLGMGIVSVIGFQILLNAVVMTGLVLWHAPGLPFVSLSGTGLIVDLMSMGLLLNLARQGNTRSG